MWKKWHSAVQISLTPAVLFCLIRLLRKLAGSRDHFPISFLRFFGKVILPCIIYHCRCFIPYAFEIFLHTVFFFRLIFIYVPLLLCKRMPCVSRCLRRSEESMLCSGTRLIEGSELPDMGAGSRTHVLCRNCMHFSVTKPSLQAPHCILKI